MKLFFDNLTNCCDVSVRSVANRVREIVGMGMEFVQVQLILTLYTKLEVNLLIANT